jgi:hypothetical protein
MLKMVNECAVPTLSGATTLTSLRSSTSSRFEQAEREREAAARIEAKHKVRTLRAHCGVWAKYSHATFAGVIERFGPDAKISRVARKLEHLLQDPRTYVLCDPERGGQGGQAGSYRRGKSWLLSAAVHAFCDARRPAAYMTAVQLFNRLKSTFSAAAKETYADVYDWLVGLDHLSLDECHLRSDTDWENTTFRAIIDHRKGNLKSTLLSGNLKPSSLREYLGPAVVLRINEPNDNQAEGGGTIECAWPAIGLASEARGTS